MIDEQRYLFDLNGYLTILRELLADPLRKLSANLDRINLMNTKGANAGNVIRQTRGDYNPHDHLEYTCVLLPYGSIFESLIDAPATVQLG